MADEATATKTYSDKVTKIVDLFTQLNVMELLELQSALEEKGIKPAAAVAVGVAPGGGGGAAPEAAAEQTTFTVVLKDGGPKKIQVIKEVRAIMNLGLKEAKDLVEGAPKPVKEGVSKEEAAKIKKQIEDAGGVIEVK
jgi:large subunit ribosomal protein L7/L12